MRLQKAIEESVAAAFGGIWVRSHEHEDAIREIATACANFSWIPLTWDAEKGVQIPEGTICNPQYDDKDKGPLYALFVARAVKPGDKDQHVVLIMRNLHNVLFAPDGRIINPVLLQILQHTIEKGAQNGTHVVVLSNPSVKIPVEIEKQFRTLDHELPSPEEIAELFASIEFADKLPEWESTEGRMILEAAAGLTRAEAAGAASLSLAREDSIKPEILWEIKADTLKNQGVLTVEKPDSGFEMVGGYNVIKEFWLKGFASTSTQSRPRGVMLFGVPGGGKDSVIRALSYEVKRPLLSLDLGAAKGSLLGQSEERIREALKNAGRMAPCILKVSELEKFLAGSGGGAHDSGVGAAQLGYLLNWLQDHKEDVYFIGSANSIEVLSQVSGGAFLRAERFDGVFFVDLPSAEQLERIWEIWLNFYSELTPAQTQARPDATNWTGAEIKHCCRMADMLGLTLEEAAAQFVIPVAITASEQIDKMRSFAHQRCLSTDFRGIFNKDARMKFVARPESVDAKRRKVVRGPASLNRVAGPLRKI